MENASVSGFSLSVLNVYGIPNDIIILHISVCKTVLTKIMTANRIEWFPQLDMERTTVRKSRLAV